MRVTLARRGRHRRRGPSKAQPPVRKDKKVQKRNKPKAMLDEGRRTEMIYFLKEIVSDAGVSDKLAEPFLASLAAKGSRESVDSAVEFLDSKIEEEFISDSSSFTLSQVGLTGGESPLLSHHIINFILVIIPTIPPAIYKQGFKNLHIINN